MRALLIALLLSGSLTLNAQSACDSLKTLVNAMVDQYDALSIENEQIAAEMSIQRTQIDSLRSALQRGNYDLVKARQEAKVLRSIMTGYVFTVDSLNTLSKEPQRGDR